MAVHERYRGQVTDDVLAAARRGDGEAFRDLVGPHLRALHLHCYRMLGSYVEADDAVQDALLSGWPGRVPGAGTAAALAAPDRHHDVPQGDPSPGPLT